MIIGFTGSRKHMISGQMIKVTALLSKYKPILVVHGGCVGADSVFHEIAINLGIPVKVRPSNLKGFHAICPGAIEICEPEKPLVRNRKIVDECDLLIAAPDGPEKVRSGTWSTVRYARKMRKDHRILEPCLPFGVPPTA